MASTKESITPPVIPGYDRGIHLFLAKKALVFLRTLSGLRGETYILS
jgi:hypothetical protein